MVIATPGKAMSRTPLWSSYTCAHVPSWWAVFAFAKLFACACTCNGVRAGACRGVVCLSYPSRNVMSPVKLPHWVGAHLLVNAYFCQTVLIKKTLIIIMKRKTTVLLAFILPGTPKFTPTSSPHPPSPSNRKVFDNFLNKFKFHESSSYFLTNVYLYYGELLYTKNFSCKSFWNPLSPTQRTHTRWNMTSAYSFYHFKSRDNGRNQWDNVTSSHNGWQYYHVIWNTV